MEFFGKEHILMKKYYTTKEVAKMLRVHPRTIIKYIAENTLKASKVGVGWIISEKDIELFLDFRSNTNIKTVKGK